MEHYRTHCPVCGHVRTWVGYKTGIGKTPAQLEQMHKDHTTCVKCELTCAITYLNYGSRGPAFDIPVQKDAAMLEILHAFEKKLPALLEDASMWSTLLVDYHEPIVERVFMQFFNYRIYLHPIHTCANGAALFHPHNWPSAVRIVEGVYEMGIGYETDNEMPTITSRVIMHAGSEYAMTDPRNWHYVRPLTETTLSFMVTGEPYGHNTRKSTKELHPLSEKRKLEIMELFRKYYSNVK